MLVTHRIEQRDLIQLDLVKALDIDRSFGLGLLLLIVAFIAFLLFINRLVSRRKRNLKTKSILERLFGFRATQKSFSKFGLVLSFYRLFFMLCKMLYANGIKTSNTVLETGHFITSLQQLLTSDFVVCFYEDHISLEIILESEQNTVLDRLFREKSHLPAGMNSQKYSNKCVIDMSRIKSQIDLTGKALYANHLFSTLTVGKYALDNGQSNYWLVVF